jgi:hypothetical protein
MHCALIRCIKRRPPHLVGSVYVSTDVVFADMCIGRRGFHHGRSVIAGSIAPVSDHTFAGMLIALEELP